MPQSAAVTSTLSEIVGRGRTSTVYALDDDTVMKTYPDGTDPGVITAEAEAAELAYRLGVPGVRCLGLAERDGRQGIIFERLDGQSLTAIAEHDLRRFPQVCRVLAGHHVLMHSRVAPTLPDVRDRAAALLETPPLAGLTEAERAALREQLPALPEGDRLLHLDFHPQNIFSHHGGYAIIDWASACRGAAAADVAMSVLLMTEAQLWPGTPPLKRVLYLASRSAMRTRYLHSYCAQTGMTRREIARWMTCARVLRLGILDVAGERAALLARIRQGIAK